MAKARVSKSRDRYHHGALREALVGAARSMVERDGLEALSVREVARRAGVSPAAPFRHFPDKQALVAALALDALRSFAEHVERALAHEGSDPVDRFRAMGIAYIDFAIEHPARFRVMCDPALASVDTPEVAEVRERIDSARRGEVAEGIRRGFTPAGDPDSVVLAGEALAYGLARMIIDGRLSGPRKEARRRAIAALDTLGDGIDPGRPEMKRARVARDASR